MKLKLELRLGNMEMDLQKDMKKTMETNMQKSMEKNMETIMEKGDEGHNEHINNDGGGWPSNEKNTESRLSEG
jgi:hypothetical protein